MKTTLQTISLLFCFLWQGNIYAQGSDPAGIALAEKMINQLGGAKVWGKAKHLYTKQKAYPLSMDVPVTAETWRDFSKPGYLSKVYGHNLDRSESWTEKGGWEMRNGKLTKISEEDLIEEIKGSKQEPYAIYHRIAIQDPELIIKLVGDNRLDVYERNGHKLCWFILDKNAVPVSWGNIYRGRINQHVYGPLKKFEELSLPGWGSSLDSRWRFEYIEVKAMQEEFIPPPMPSHP